MKDQIAPSVRDTACNHLAKNQWQNQIPRTSAEDAQQQVWLKLHLPVPSDSEVSDHSYRQCHLQFGNTSYSRSMHRKVCTKKRIWLRLTQLIYPLQQHRQLVCNQMQIKFNLASRWALLSTSPTTQSQPQAKTLPQTFSWSSNSHWCL